MNNVLLVEVVKSADNLSENSCSFACLYLADLVEVVEESSTAEILQNEANVIFFFKKSVKFDDVRMIQLGVQFYFFDEPVNHIEFDKVFF